MSDLVAMIFNSTDQAERAREVIRQLQRDNRLSLYDAATLVKDSDGKLSVRNEIDRDVKIGAGLGGMVGLLFSLAFPLVGLAVGVAGGALVGKTLDRDIDRQFVDEVGAALQPGESGLCVLIRDGEATALRAAAEPFVGRLFQTTLDPDLEAQLRDALKT